MAELGRPRVVVQLQEDPGQEGFDDPVQYLAARDPAALKRVLRLFGEISLTPVFSEQSREALPELQRLAMQRDPAYRPAPLTRFFYVEAEASEDLVELAKALAGSAAVRSAEVEIPGPDPAVNDADDPLAAGQGYLGFAPGGFEARYAWTFPGGDGAGQRIIDMEQGWTLDHEDLVAHGATLLSGTIVDSSRAHGTAALGVVCAVDNTVGCVGFAPNVASVYVASVNPNLANTIVGVLPRLEFGDVMLLEVQYAVPGSAPPMYGPSDIIEVIRAAARLATALGVVVVEAGGNGTNGSDPPAVDLDAFTDAAGRRVLWRDPGNADFDDSGAIIVAAATWRAPHTRRPYSTHGLRVDCFGWGQNVVTCSSDETGATDLYRSDFAGTSAASATVAGAALCVQGLYEAATDGGRLSPRQMRRILSDGFVNTPPALTETTRIGVMPNLRGIIDRTLGFVPDVYIRDNVGDTGDPHAGAIARSPDVFLRPVAVDEPQAAFGEDSGTENDMNLGFRAEAGHDNYLYVRVRNRGGSGAFLVNAQVFWSPPATLVTPDLWTEIGTVTLPAVPTGEILTCSDALVWPAGEIPEAGHYCFVALIGTFEDPAPAPAAFHDFDSFRSFIRNNNNVTWRNFDVIPVFPEDPEARSELPWILPGAPDGHRPFALELVMRLPREAEVLLELPLQFLRDFDAQLQLDRVDPKTDRGTALLPGTGRLVFGPALVAAKARYEMRLLVRVRSKDPDAVYRIEARQLFEGQEEVGRITWLFDPHAQERLEQARKTAAPKPRKRRTGRGPAQR